MKLDATYQIADVVELIKADLAGKGFNLVGTPDLTEFVDFKISFSVDPTPQAVKPTREYAPKAVTEKEIARRKVAGERLRNINKAKLADKDQVAEPEPEALPEPEEKKNRLAA